MIIHTLEELTSYVKQNFEKMSNSQFEKLLNTTLKIYPLEKPKSLNEALQMINHYGNIPLESRPLFPEITEFDEN